MIFSNPGSYADTLFPGVSQMAWLKWLKVQRDPRFMMQLKKRDRAKAAALAQSRVDWGLVSPEPASPASRRESNKKDRKPKPPRGLPMPKDWSTLTGMTTGYGVDNERLYPAKFTFDTVEKSCTGDFVVIPTFRAGATSSGAPYSQAGTFSGVPSAGETIAITNILTAPDQTLTLTADATANTALQFAVGGTPAAAASNLANAIARNGLKVGVTAVASGNTVTIASNATNVAVTSINTSASLSNFSLSAEAAGTGTTGQATIFALNQLYADSSVNGGCQTATQAVPAVMWSYNTATGFKVNQSPVLSYYDDGAQVAFVQTGASGVSGAVLVLLKWSSTVSVGTLDAPTVPAIAASAAAYRTCPAPCMYRITFGQADTFSAPYVDYSSDTLCVGDDAGNLHKFTGVFNGTPTEVGSPFAIVAPGVSGSYSSGLLTAPVYDPVTGRIFVGSSRAGNGLRKFYSVDGTTGTVVSSGQISVVETIDTGSTSVGIVDSPILDPAAQRVYVFVQSDNGGTDTLGNVCSLRCTSVFQFSTTESLSTQNAGLGAGLGSKVILTAANSSYSFNAGAFDDAYYASPDASAPSGSLYACAQVSPLTLWKIDITGNMFTAKTQGPTLMSSGVSTAECAPLTAFKNSGAEFLYASVTDRGGAIGGSGCSSPVDGCLYSYRLSPATFNTPTSSSTFPNANTDRFISISNVAALATNEASVQTTFSAAQAGTYQGMTITQPSNPGLSFTYTLRRNGISEGLTCTVSTTSATTCGDSTHSISIAAGDVVDVLVHRNSGGSALTGVFRVQLGWHPNLPAAGAIQARGGTGGVIVDNTVDGGGSQLYFMTRNHVGETLPSLAVQASQVGLQ